MTDATNRAAAEATGVAADFIARARAYLSQNYLPKIERCLAELTDEDVWWRPNEESNSIGNLLLHLEGSTRMWILSGAGGAPIERERQKEFDARTGLSRAELLARLRETLAECDRVLAGLDAATLAVRREVWDMNPTVLESVFHAVEHFSMHAGQIFMLTKMRAAKNLKLSD